MGKYNPTWKVSGLTLTRDGYKFTAKWTVPNAATSAKVTEKVKNKKTGKTTTKKVDAPNRFNGILVKWTLNLSGVKDSTDLDKSGNEKLKTLSESFGSKNGFIMAAGKNKGKPVTRAMLYPNTDYKVADVSVQVCGNHKANGKDHKGPWAGPVKYSFKAPRAPSVTLTYDNAGNAVLKVETDAGKDHQERYDTVVSVDIVKQDGKTATLQSPTSTTKEDWSKKFDISQYITGLAQGKHVTVKASAYARGLAGDSTTVSKSLTVAMPVAATLGAITVSKKAPGGVVKVVTTAGKYTTGVQLQRRLEGESSWTDVAGGVDNGNVKCLYDSWGAVWPTGQKQNVHVYYRVKSTRHAFEVYSAEKSADCLFTTKPPLTCPTKAKFVNYLDSGSGDAALKPSRNGTKATVRVNFEGSKKPTGVRLYWTDNKTGWNSTNPADSYDQPVTKADSAKGVYSGSVSFALTGLTPGKTYYVKAQCYLTEDGETAYGTLTDWNSFQAESAQDDVCGIISVAPDEDGQGAKVLVGYWEDNKNTGTEVQWSDYRYAWQSNYEPKSLNATWAGSAYTGADDWQKQQDVYLRELEPGKTYYVKARRYLESDSTTTRSNWSKLETFQTPATMDDAGSYSCVCGLVSVSPGTDGKSAAVVVGWSNDRTGCEVTWSTDADAWESSVQPESREFDWSDKSSKSSSWAATGTFYLHDLEEGETYYVKARSYYEPADGDRVWSGYSDHLTVTPYSAPSSVALYPPNPVARGENIDLYWTVESEVEQKEWHVHESGKPYSSLANGTGSLCHATITPDRYGSASSLTLYVDAGCGGGLTSSNAVVAAIAQRPTCEVACPATLADQPASFTAYTADPSVSLLATCRSLGVTRQAPDGDRDQLPGDPVWTRRVTPAWTATTWGATVLRAQLSEAVTAARAAHDEAAATLAGMTEGDEGYDEAATAEANTAAALSDAQAALAAHPSSGACYAATVTMPDSLELVDGGSYEVTAKTVEPVAGLTSGESACRFSVAWSHQAPTPSGDTFVDPDEANRTVAVTIARPEDWAEGDVHDLYRKTPTGYELIARNLPAACVVTDPYAPYGADADLAYRVSCRTADGDEQFVDYPYEMDAPLRVDWPGGSVELPYNVELSDGYEKSFEARGHADGSVNGYFDKAVTMTGSYRSDVVKADAEQLALVREMAEHPGACFVRTRQGMAFQCNCEAREIATSYSTATAAIQLSVTKVDLTDLYMLPQANIREGGE